MLIELYTLEATCYAHEAMDYCPVLVQISEPLQSKFYSQEGYRYLIQVWSKENEKKVYEKPFISKAVIT